MTKSAIFVLLSLGLANAATHDVTWSLGTSQSLTVEVGDVINFNWNQAVNHNVQWNPALFVQSTNSNDPAHVETYVIPQSAQGVFYTVICGIHPSMQLLLTVQGDDSAAPSAAPSASPTRSPIGTNETHAPSAAPTDVPSVSPTVSPSDSPTPFPTIQIVTRTTKTDGMTTVVVVGIIIASIGMIGALGVGGWSYLRYKRCAAKTKPMKIEASSTARYRMSNF